MKVIKGTTTPSPTLGDDGDMYIDTVLGKIYVKEELNTWDLLTTASNVAAASSAAAAAVSAAASAASAALAPEWTKYTVGHAALAAASLTNDIELFSLPAKSMILGIFAKSTTAFSGGSISAYGISIGYNGNLAHFLGGSPYDVLAATDDTNFAFNAIPVDIFDFGSAVSIRIAATSVGDNLDQAAAGSVDIYVQTSALPA